MNKSLDVKNAHLRDDKIYLLLLAMAYGIVDGFNAVISTLRLIFDVMYKNNNQLSATALRKWMSTPLGLLILILETLVLTSLSLLTNMHPDPDDKSAFKEYWSASRDTLKSFKNSYKGIRGLVQTIDIPLNTNSSYIIIPIWLVLGLLSMANRAHYRKFDASRKKIKQQNKALLEKINCMEYDPVRLSEIKPYTLNDPDNNLGYRSKAYSGIIDGLYLYMGTAVMLTFAPAAFALITSYSVIFTLTCIAVRVYEEYDRQREVFISEDQVKLAICALELKALFKAQDKSAEKDLLQAKMNAFLTMRHESMSRFKRSSGEAILEGLKHGLAIHGALSALVFSAYTVAFALAWSFPPALVLASVTIGIWCLIMCSTWQYIKNDIEIQKQAIIDARRQQDLVDLCSRDSNGKLFATQTHIDAIITDSIQLQRSKPSSIPTSAEVFRAGFSAFGKAPKAIEFFFCTLQKIGEDGRAYDTPLMLLLMLPCTVFYVFALGVSTYYDPWGEDKNKAVQAATKNVHSWTRCLFKFFQPSPTVAPSMSIQTSVIALQA